MLSCGNLINTLLQAKAVFEYSVQYTNSIKSMLTVHGPIDVSRKTWMQLYTKFIAIMHQLRALFCKTSFEFGNFATSLAPIMFKSTIPNSSLWNYVHLHYLLIYGSTAQSATKNLLLCCQIATAVLTTQFSRQHYPLYRNDSRLVFLLSSSVDYIDSAFHWLWTSTTGKRSVTRHVFD